MQLLHHGNMKSICALSQNACHSSYCNAAPSLITLQRRTKVFNLHSKMLFHPKYKKVYIHPRKKKEFQFTEDTLRSLSHGEDNMVKVRVADYPQLNKHKYTVYPNRFVLRLWSDILGLYMWLPVSRKGLDKIHQAGTVYGAVHCEMV